MGGLTISERDRKTLRFGGIAVGAIVLLMVFGFPLVDYWDKLNKELTDRQKKYAAIQTGLDDAIMAAKSMQELRQKASVYPDRVALNQQTARMLQQVEQIPGFSQLTVPRLEGLPLREEEDFYRSAVSMQFTGSLQNLHQFVQGVETASPALKVERLTVTADQNDTSRVEGQMVITGYAVVMRKGKSG